MTEPRYICVAMPSDLEADRVATCISDLKLADQLGAGRFKRANWHQSLSDQYWPREMPDLEAKLQRACAAISACAVTLNLNRIVRDEGYCALYADGTSDFRALLLAVKAALASQGIASRAANKPHITLSYWGSAAGPELQIAPIEWTINRVLVVKGRGDGDSYHYDIVAAKDLHAPPKGEQMRLFTA